MLSKSIKDCIERYIYYINENKFNDFYYLIDKEIPNKLSVRDVGKITKYLKKADISPIVYCDSVPSNYFCGDLTLQKIAIPSFFIGIGSRAFLYCNKLKTVVIPKSVKFINDFAFSSCTSLSEVVYDGTKAELLNITFGKCVFSECKNLTYIKCNDGRVYVDTSIYGCV